MRIIPARKPVREVISPEPSSSVVARRARPTAFAFCWHYHPEAELTYIVEGEGLRFVGNSIEAFGPGDLIFLGANVLHTWQSSATAGPRRASVESIVLQFAPSLWGTLLDQLPEFGLLRALLHAASNGISVDPPKLRSQVQATMNLILETPPQSLDRWLLLTQALQLIARGWAKKNGSVRTVSAAAQLGNLADAGTRRIERVLRAMQNSLEQGTRLKQSEAASCAGLSPASFSRFFRQRVGRSYARYASEWHVELACRTLVNTDLPIIQIAFDCGFQNLSNFNRRFLEIKGMTPREMRRRHQS